MVTALNRIGVARPDAQAAVAAMRDFTRADAIRDERAEKGIELLDTMQGTRWKKKG